MKKEESPFISLAEAAKMTNYSQDYISLLCRQGKLKAQKLGRNWVTKKEWVYSYVDNTSGRGESVVPVKVKASVEVKKSAPAHKQKFYGQSALETAFFCFACFVWIINVFLFVNYMEKSNLNASSSVKASSLSTDYDYVPPVAETVRAESSESDVPVQAVGVGQEPLGSLAAFIEETDPEAIAQATDEIRNKFSGDIEMRIYKGFAVLNQAGSVNQKFLYVLGESK